jgi:hypothetical protein
LKLGQFILWLLLGVVYIIAGLIVIQSPLLTAVLLTAFASTLIRGASTRDRNQTGRVTMTAVPTGQPVLLLKKLGGMLMLIAGTALTAFGFYLESSGTKAAGAVLLALGLLLLILKIVRRNQPSS